MIRIATKKNGITVSGVTLRCGCHMYNLDPNDKVVAMQLKVLRDEMGLIECDSFDVPEDDQTVGKTKRGEDTDTSDRGVSNEAKDESKPRSALSKRRNGKYKAVKVRSASSAKDPVLEDESI